MFAGADTLSSLFLERARAGGSRPGALYKRDGIWKPFSCTEWFERSLAVARGLAAMGAQPGRPIVLAARASIEWLITSWGIAFSGHPLVPFHPTAPATEFAEMLRLVQPAFVFLGDPELLVRYREPLIPLSGRIALFSTEVVVGDPQPGSRPLLRLQDLGLGTGVVSSLAQLEELGNSGRASSSLDATEEPWPDDSPAMIVFTPGTLGEQRGVALSHRSLLYEARTLSSLLPLSADDLQLLFLPLSHILGIISCLTSVAAGVPLALGGGVRTLLEDLEDIKPTFLVGVPRVFEKILEKIQTVAMDFGPLWREVFRRGIEASRNLHEARDSSRLTDFAQRLQVDFARRTVFSRCREMFGGRMRFVVSGGAPLAPDTAHAMVSFGIPVLEGFGLTETCGATHMNRFDACMPGTVGPPLPGVETRIAPDGEVLIRSPGLMSGYLRDPEATREAIDADGWFHSGDLGTVDTAGCLRITGRKKNLIVLANGKNVVPAKVEAVLQAIPLVSNCLVLGDRRSYLVALVTLNRTRTLEWAADLGLEREGFDKLRTDIRLYRELEQQIEKACQTLAPHERVRRFAILEADFSPETGELTHDFKVRRNVVTRQYQNIIDLLYKERY